MTAAFAEHFVLHDFVESFKCLVPCLADKHTLAERESVSFYNDGHGSGLYVFSGFFRSAEGFVSGCGNAVLFHQILRENLASFDYSCLFLRTEAGNSDFFKLIYHTEHKRVVGSNYGKSDVMVFCEIYNSGNILRTDGNAFSLGHSAVSGERVYLVYLLAFTQLFYNSVFSSA